MDHDHPAGDPRGRESDGGAEARLLRFGLFELDLVGQELSREGRRVHLTAQPFQLLSLLALRAGELVTRREIRDHLWGPDVHVEFDQGINALVREVRRVLGDDASSPRFIATLPRRGYRFLAPVERIAPTAASAPGTEEATTPGRTPHGARGESRRWLWAGSGAALAAAALTLLALVHRAPAHPPSAPTLAVLPFDALGPQGDDDLAEGLTEDLIAHLGRRFRNRLAVTSPTSAFAFTKAGESPRAFARRLGVEYLLTGSLRRQGDLLWISVRLTGTDDGRVLWATTYHRRAVDLLALQDRVAESIAEALAVQLLPREDWSVEAPASGEAQLAYLRGQNLLQTARRTLGSAREARRWFQRAVELDPGFASAWAGLAEATRRSGPPTETTEEVRRDLARALALDDDTAWAHLLVGKLDFYAYLDFSGSRRHFQRAIEINPSYAEAHHALGAWLAAQGRPAEARAELERAAILDPLSAAVRSDGCWFALFARRWSPAVDAAERTLAHDPAYPFALECRVLARLGEGDLGQALNAAGEDATAMRTRLSPAFVPGSAEADAEEGAWRSFQEASGTGPARTALRAYWKWKVALLAVVAASPRGQVSREERAVPHAYLGETKIALDLLEGGLAERVGWRLPFIAVDPEFDPLRGDPRFERLVAQVLGRSAP